MESRSSLGKDATLSGIRKHQLHGRKKMFIAVAVDEILKLEVLPQILFVKAIMGVDCTVIEYIMVYNEQRWP